MFAFPRAPELRLVHPHRRRDWESHQSVQGGPFSGSLDRPAFPNRVPLHWGERGELYCAVIALHCRETTPPLPGDALCSDCPNGPHRKSALTLILSSLHPSVEHEPCAMNHDFFSFASRLILLALGP